MERKESLEDQVRCEFEGTVMYVPRKIFCMMVLRCQYPDKKYIRYKEGAVMYSMSEREFYKLAHNAGAIHKVNKMVLVNVAKIYEFLNYFREE